MPIAEAEKVTGVLGTVTHQPVVNLINGGMGPAWAAHIREIATFIKANKIPAVSHVIDQVRKDAAFKPLETALDWGWRNGGWPGPHLHYEGHLYPLNPAQWDAFSKPLVGSLVEKLKAANKVTFEQFTTIG